MRFRKGSTCRPQIAAHCPARWQCAEPGGTVHALIAAGGTLRYDEEAPAFWVLADPEGNEACITTWQGREG